MKKWKDKIRRDYRFYQWGSILQEEWNAMRKKEDGFNAIVTVALIAVMIAVAAVLIRMMGIVVQPVGTSVEKFLSGRI